MSENLFKNILMDDKFITNPVCMMLIGPPACGKSTYRAEMLDLLVDPVVISGDDLIEAEAVRLGKTYSEVFPDVDFKEQKKVLRTAFDGAVKRGADIVIDRTNMSAKARRSFLATLPKNYTKVAVVFEYEPEALFARIIRRGEETGKNIPRQVVEEMIAQYQAPTMDEFHRIEKFNSFRGGL